MLVIYVSIWNINKGGKNMSDLRKQYEVEGIICKPSKMAIFPNVSFFVNVTKDKKGCTVSVGNEDMDLQFVVPFDEMLKDLRR